MEFTVKCTVGYTGFNCYVGAHWWFTKGKCYKVENGYIYDDLNHMIYVGTQAKCAKDVVFGFHEHHIIYSIDFEDVDVDVDIIYIDAVCVKARISYSYNTYFTPEKYYTICDTGDGKKYIIDDRSNKHRVFMNSNGLYTTDGIDPSCFEVIDNGEEKEDLKRRRIGMNLLYEDDGLLCDEYKLPLRLGRNPWVEEFVNESVIYLECIVEDIITVKSKPEFIKGHYYEARDYGVKAYVNDENGSDHVLIKMTDENLYTTSDEEETWFREVTKEEIIKKQEKEQMEVEKRKMKYQLINMKLKCTNLPSDTTINYGFEIGDICDLKKDLASGKCFVTDRYDNKHFIVKEVSIPGSGLEYETLYMDYRGVTFTAVTTNFKPEKLYKVKFSENYTKGDTDMMELFETSCKKIYFGTRGVPEIEDVKFNGPATIVFWVDGTKTVVKCQEGDTFDPEKGLTMAICKKLYGNKGSYCNKLKKWLPEEKKEEVESPISKNSLSRCTDDELLDLYVNGIITEEAYNKIMHSRYAKICTENGEIKKPTIDDLRDMFREVVGSNEEYNGRDKEHD